MPLRDHLLSLTAGTSGLDAILSLVWMLVCVVAVAVLAYLFTRYVGGRGGLPGMSAGSEQLKVLARLSLGREQSLALVRAGERFLLLGVTAAGISLVAELTQEEAQALYAPPADRSAPPSFGEALRTVLKQKKPR